MGSLLFAFRNLTKRLIDTSVRNHWFWLLVPLFQYFVVKECTVAGKKRCWFSTKLGNQRPTLLALAADQFRGELQILVSKEGFRVLTISDSWNHRVAYPFFDDMTYTQKLDAVMYYQRNGANNSKLQKSYEKADDFLTGFLGRLYSRLRVDAVLLHNVRYPHVLCWAAVSKRLQVPYIVIYREGVCITKWQKKMQMDRHSSYGQFEGDLILVKNKLAKEVFVEPGFATTDQVVVTGDSRFDVYLQQLKDLKLIRNENIVTIFWWSITHYEGREFNHMTRTAIRAIAELAKEMCHVKFVVKPKPEYLPQYKTGSSQLDIAKIFDNTNRLWRKQGNLVITPFANVHELIFKSKVIVGLQSTVLLEAAIARKFIVVPDYEEFRTSTDGGRFAFRPILELFETANNDVELKAQIKRGLKDDWVSDEVMRKRNANFSSLIADMDGNNSRRVRSAIMSKIAR